MRKTACAVATLFLCCWPVFGQDHGATVEAAEKSAQSWLSVVDSGHYGESWEKAAVDFQSKITKQKWESSLQSVRAPLGAVRSRNLKTATYTTDLPHAAKGEYVLLQYQTSFANLKSAIETVAPMKEVDGSFKVSGYYIRPAD